jgi:hypothetical protein
MYRVTSSIHSDYIEFYIRKENSHKFSVNVFIQLEVVEVKSIHAAGSSCLYL